MTPAGEPAFPTTATRGAVYVVRDPRAVAVSFASHRNRDIDDTIDRMENRVAVWSESIPRLSQQLLQRPGHWSDHGNRGWAHRFQCILCVMRTCTAIRMLSLPRWRNFSVYLAIAKALRPRSRRRRFLAFRLRSARQASSRSQPVAGVLPRRSRRRMAAGPDSGAGKAYRDRARRRHAAMQLRHAAFTVHGRARSGIALGNRLFWIVCHGRRV